MQYYNNFPSNSKFSFFFASGDSGDEKPPWSNKAGEVINRRVVSSQRPINPEHAIGPIHSERHQQFPVSKRSSQQLFGHHHSRQCPCPGLGPPFRSKSILELPYDPPGSNAELNPRLHERSHGPPSSQTAHAQARYLSVAGTGRTADRNVGAWTESLPLRLDF